MLFKCFVFTGILIYMSGSWQHATVVDAVIVHLAESKGVLTTVSSRLPGWIPVSGIRVSYLSRPLPFEAAFCTI